MFLLLNIYIYIVLHHFILLIICLAQTFSQLFMDPAVDFSSVLFAMPPKREALNALLVTPPAPGVRPATADGAPVESEEAAPVCLAGLKRWAQNQYLGVPLFDWEVVADKPRNHFHASPFPSSLQEDEDSSFHAKTAMLSGLGLCNGAVHSSVPFRPACMTWVTFECYSPSKPVRPIQLKGFSSQSGWCQSYSTKLGGIPDEADPASRFSCPGFWPQFCPPHAVIDVCALPKPAPNVGTRP